MLLLKQPILSSFLRSIMNHSSWKLHGTVDSGHCGRSFCSSTKNKTQVREFNVHFEQVGNGEHVVLMLPGAVGTARNDFAPQLDGGLSPSKFTLIAWDPPGYGASRPPDRKWNDFYSRDADMAAELMAKLGFNKYSLIGWSDGGITGLMVSARNPKNITKLVAFGASAYLTKGDVDAIGGIRDLDKWNPKARAHMEGIYGKDYFGKLWNNYVDAYHRVYSTYNGDICKNELKNITCPTLILHGDKDPLVPPEHPVFLSENIKGAKLVRFPDGKHNIHMRYAKEFNQIVEEFLLS